MQNETAKRVIRVIVKYKYVAAIILLGVVLLLLPSKEKAAPEGMQEPIFDRGALEREMETLLSAVDGAGKLSLMLTVSSDGEKKLARNEEQGGTAKSTTVTVGAGSGIQEPVVTQYLYPRYIGAVVVCEGADSASVRLRLTEALCALTGLTSDKIAVIRGKP